MGSRQVLLRCHNAGQGHTNKHDTRMGLPPAPPACQGPQSTCRAMLRRGAALPCPVGRSAGEPCTSCAALGLVLSPCAGSGGRDAPKFTTGGTRGRASCALPAPSQYCTKPPALSCCGTLSHLADPSLSLPVVAVAQEWARFVLWGGLGLALGAVPGCRRCRWAMRFPEKIPPLGQRLPFLPTASRPACMYRPERREGKAEQHVGSPQCS